MAHNTQYIIAAIWRDYGTPDEGVPNISFWNGKSIGGCRNDAVVFDNEADAHETMDALKNKYDDYYQYEVWKME